jgi:hypothetical protein
MEEVHMYYHICCVHVWKEFLFCNTYNRLAICLLFSILHEHQSFIYNIFSSVKTINLLQKLRILFTCCFTGFITLHTSGGKATSLELEGTMHHGPTFHALASLSHIGPHKCPHVHDVLPVNRGFRETSQWILWQTF